MALDLLIDVGGVPHTPRGCAVWRLKLNADTPALWRMVPSRLHYSRFGSDEIRCVLGKIAGVESVIFPTYGEVDLHVRHGADLCAVKAGIELAAAGVQLEVARAA